MHSCCKNVETSVCFGDSSSKVIEWFYVDNAGEKECKISDYSHERLCREIASILYEAYKIFL